MSRQVGESAAVKNGRTPEWTRKDWIILILLFFLFSSLYFATASGITSSNDGSHYALVRTMAENKAFALQQFDDYAEGNDIAITEDGRLFSDRPPGTALFGLLYYSVGQWLPPGEELPSRHDGQNPSLVYLLMLPAMAGAGTVVLLYALSRQLNLNRGASLMAAVVLGLGTAHWKYSSVLFSHALSSFLVFSSLFLIIFVTRKGQIGWKMSFLVGFLLGFSVLVEYSNGLWVLIAIIYLLWRLRPGDVRSVLVICGPLVAGGLVSAAFLAFYNQANFGSPLRLSYAYAINYPWASSFTTTFNYPLSQGLQSLLFFGSGDGWCGGTCFNQGIFLLSPVLLLAIPGWFFFYRQNKGEFFLILITFLIYLLLFARHRTSHGFTADGRYLVPFLGFLVLPIGFTFEKIFSLSRRSALQATLLFFSYGLLFMSVGNIYLHIGRSYNYNLDLGLLSPMIADPMNMRYLFDQVIRNGANLPLLWLVEALVFSIILLLGWLLAGRKRS